VNRALRAATMGVLLLSPVALSACSAGQVTQTATQERDKTGAQAQAGDITLREVQLAYPRGGTYDEGDDAELLLAIVNGGDTPDTLTGVEGKGFGGADISGDEIELPVDETVFIGQGGNSVTLTDLGESLTTGQVLEVTLTFEEAGDITVPVTVSNPRISQERGKKFNFDEGRESSGQVARDNEDSDNQ
jgi:copper(I)-binding protein